MVAPPPPPLPEPGDEPDSALASAQKRFFGHVRDVRVACQDLELALTDIERAGQVAEAKARKSELSRAVAEGIAVFGSNQPLVESTFSSVRDLFEQYPSIYDGSGDEVGQMEASWRRLLAGWPRNPDPGDEALARTKASSALLGAIVFRAGRLTVPDRVNAHLRFCRVGKTLDFHETFRDELPAEADRRDVLRYLHAHPTKIEGVVDAERGLIFRTSPKFGVRVATYAAPVLAVAVGALLVLATASIDDWLGLADWPTQLRRAGPLLTGYLFVLLGALVHVVVEALQHARFGTGETSFLAIEDLLAWLHIRYLSISLSVLWVLVGLVGLAASSDKLHWETAFLVGFSIDTLGGLFLQRFTQSMVRQRKALVDSIAPGSS